MSAEPIARAADYHYRAEELRTLADSMTTEFAKDALLRTATAYDRLAERQEKGVQPVPDPETFSLALKLRPVRFSEPRS